MQKLMAHDLNIPLSDEILQSENNAMTIEDKCLLLLPKLTLLEK